MSKPAHIRMDLARIQDLIEISLKQNSYLVGPMDILELVADAFYSSENTACAQELQDLMMRWRGYQIGLSKVPRI